MSDVAAGAEFIVLSPEQIEARSFEIISRLLPEIDQTRPEWPVLRRIVHALGDPDIASVVRFHPLAIEAGVRALRSGCPIIVDVAMVATGISGSLARQLGCEVLCAIADPAVEAMAKEQGLTRSAAVGKAASSSTCCISSRIKGPLHLTRRPWARGPGR